MPSGIYVQPSALHPMGFSHTVSWQEPRVSCAHLLGLGEISWKLRNGVITLCLQMEGMEVNCLIPYFPLRQIKIIRGDMVPPLKIRKVFFPLLKGGGTTNTPSQIVPKRAAFVSTLCSKSLDIYDKQTPPSKVLSHCVGVRVYAHIHPLCGLVPILYTHIVGLCSFSLCFVPVQCVSYIHI